MNRYLTAIKVTLFLVLLIPFALIIWDGFNDNLTADPIEEILHRTGIWSLRILLLTLLMTPLKIITGSALFIRVRRLFGLFTFFYATLHLVVYVWLDLGLDWAHFFEDVVERPYITVGMLAWLLMLPMAITSNRRMVRKLGAWWKKLHRAIYAVIALGCLHFLWLVKSDVTEPLIYTGIGLILLVFRFIQHKYGQRKARIAASSRP